MNQQNRCTFSVDELATIMSQSDRQSSIHTGTIDFLLSFAGQNAAEKLHTQDLSEQNSLTLLSALRQQFSANEAGALLSLVKLRQRAATKFPDADKLYFVPEALEQATAWEIAARRAQWIHQHAPPGPILDLGCGIGGDTFALAHHRQVIAYERDEVRLRLAQANAHALDLADRIEFRQADWLADLQADTLPRAATAFVDPARRINGRRVFSLHQTQPPLAALITLQQQIPALCIKVMPSVSDTELPTTCDVEFISHEKICKEAVLWFGPLRFTSAKIEKTTEEQMPNVSAPPNPASFVPTHPARRATVQLNATGWRTITASGQAPPVGDLHAGQFLHEPDPAVIRAGAFAELCIDLNAHLFDPQIAYLVTAQAGTHPLTQSFELLEIHLFSIKQLNKRLRALGIERVELKKRGFPVEPEQLRSKLKLATKTNQQTQQQSEPNRRQGVVLFTRRGDQRLMLIAKRIVNQ